MPHPVHWRNLANTTEPSMCGGDAACCQNTLITCLITDHFSGPSRAVGPMCVFVFPDNK